MYKLRDHLSKPHQQQIEDIDVKINTFNTAVSIGLHALIGYTYKRYALPRHQHDVFDRAWFMSNFNPSHPYHKLKQYADLKVIPILREADNYAGAPLQTRFRWLDQKYDELEQHIKEIV